MGGAVQTGQLVPGEVRQAVTGAGVRGELLSDTAGPGAQGTLAPAGPSVVLQLYAGAERGAVHVHRDRVNLQLCLLWKAGTSQAVQAKTLNKPVLVGEM